MQARTAFRLAMLENGYQPLLNDCKRPIEKGWPKQQRDIAHRLHGLLRQLPRALQPLAHARLIVPGQRIHVRQLDLHHGQSLADSVM